MSPDPTSVPPTGAAARGRSALLRLAACMVGLGICTGLAFPPFVTAIGVGTPAQTGAAAFRLACLTAGVVVGWANYLLVRAVVGRRLTELAQRMRQVGDVVTSATRSGDWSGLLLSGRQLPVDTQDELGQPAIAFNALLAALEDNIQARHHLEVALRHQAFHDPLTGLANRALFLERARMALLRRPTSGGRPTILYLDLDGFKAVNDELGHAAGDAVLVATAARLRCACRAEDTVARLGGDEFAILMEDLPPDAVQVVADRAAAAVAEPVDAAGTFIAVGVSIGIAPAQHGQETADQLLKRADAAMYTAKRARRDRADEGRAAQPGPGGRQVA